MKQILTTAMFCIACILPVGMLCIAFGVGITGGEPWQTRIDKCHRMSLGGWAERNSSVVRQARNAFNGNESHNNFRAYRKAVEASRYGTPITEKELAPNPAEWFIGIAWDAVDAFSRWGTLWLILAVICAFLTSHGIIAYLQKLKDHDAEYANAEFLKTIGGAEYLDAEHQYMEEVTPMKFREYHWFIPKGRVLYTESATLVSETDTTLVYESHVGTLPVTITYEFNARGLHTARYARR